MMKVHANKNNWQKVCQFICKYITLRICSTYNILMWQLKKHMAWESIFQWNILKTLAIKNILVQKKKTIGARDRIFNQEMNPSYIEEGKEKACNNFSKWYHKIP